MPCSNLFALFIICVYLCCNVNALARGNIIRVQKRSSYEFQTTEWSALPASFCPRFLHDNRVELDTKKVAGTVLSAPSSNPQWKMSFSFLDDRFVTPWLILADKRGNNLHYIDFTFIYHGSDIVDVKWDVTYFSDNNDNTKWLKEGNWRPIIINYGWQEVASKQIAAGMITMLSCTFLVSIILLLLAAISANGTSLNASSLPTEVTTQAKSNNNTVVPNNTFAHAQFATAPPKVHEVAAVLVPTMSPDTISSSVHAKNRSSQIHAKQNNSNNIENNNTHPIATFVPKATNKIE